MKSFVFATLASAISMSAAFADAVPLDLYIGGRAVPVQGGGYVYAWPGVYFEGAFSGDSVDVKVDDNQDNLYVYADGAHKLTLTRPGKATITLKDLGPGKHVVRIEKASETQAASGRFYGFFVASKDQALPAPSYSRRIEFIGDSYTVGYGNTSRGQSCSTADVDDTTDTSRAFAPLTAKAFNAAYRIQAFSGRGVVRNYNGIVPGETLPVLYRYALFDKSAGAPEDGWVPDVIVIGLGTNDFSTELHAGEAWATRDALRTDFAKSYAGFIAMLHGKYPAAHFILMASDLANHEIANGATAAADLAKAQGVSDIEVILFTGLDYQACHAHPSLKDDLQLTRMLTDRLSLLPEFAPAK